MNSVLNLDLSVSKLVIPIVIEETENTITARRWEFSFRLHKQIYGLIYRLYSWIRDCFFIQIDITPKAKIIKRWVFKDGKFIEDNNETINGNTVLYLKYSQ